MLQWKLLNNKRNEPFTKLEHNSFFAVDTPVKLDYLMIYLIYHIMIVMVGINSPHHLFYSNHSPVVSA